MDRSCRSCPAAAVPGIHVDAALQQVLQQREIAALRPTGEESVTHGVVWIAATIHDGLKDGLTYLGIVDVGAVVATGSGEGRLHHHLLIPARISRARVA